MPIAVKVLDARTVTATTPIDLYTVPAAKSAMITSVRVTNNVAATLTFNLFVRASGAGTQQHLIKPSYALAGNTLLAMDDVVTLGAGDKIQLTISSASPNFDSVVLGFERD